MSSRANSLIPRFHIGDLYRIVRQVLESTDKMAASKAEFEIEGTLEEPQWSGTWGHYVTCSIVAIGKVSERSVKEKEDG